MMTGKKKNMGNEDKSIIFCFEGGWMELHGCQPKNSGDLSLLFSTFHTQITGGFFWARNLRPFKFRKHQVPGGLEWNVLERLLVRTEIPRSLRGKEIPLGYLWWLGTKMKDVYPTSKDAKNSDTFSDVWRGEANTSPNKNSRDLETFNCSPFIVAWKMLGLQMISSVFLIKEVLNKKPVTIEKNVKLWTKILFCHCA